MFGSANNAEIFKFKLRHKTKPFYAKNNGEKQSQSQVLQLCYFLIIGMPAGAFLVDNLVGEDEDEDGVAQSQLRLLTHISKSVKRWTEPS